jgi:thioredoxin
MKQLLLLPSLLLSLFFVSCTSKTNEAGKIKENLNVEAFEAKIKTDVILVDVRTPEEFNQSHLAKAINIDINAETWAEALKKLDKTKTILVYCKSGGRSARAADDLAAQGFSTVYNLEGGIMKWVAAGKSVEQLELNTTSAGMTLADYNELVKNDKYVLVDFHAKWCGPCKQLSPILEKIAKERAASLILEKVDADQNQSLLVEKGIDGIPYLELYKNGKLVWKHQGFISEKELLVASGLK